MAASSLQQSSSLQQGERRGARKSNDEQDRSSGDLELAYAETSTHKADIFTKDMQPKEFQQRLLLMGAGRRTSTRTVTGGHGAVCLGTGEAKASRGSSASQSRDEE